MRPARDQDPSTPPATIADCAIDAIILGAALLTASQPHGAHSTHAAARMELLACCRRAGLLDREPRREVLAEFDPLMRTGTDAPARLRRLMVLAMNRLVGTAWAEDVLIAIARIGTISAPLTPQSRVWLERIRLALALAPDLAAAPASDTAAGPGLAATPPPRPPRGAAPLAAGARGRRGGGKAPG
jgi:hypothetical protein